MLLIRRMILVAVILNVVRTDNKLSSPKVIHRLVGGHMKIIHDDLIDAELMTSESGGRSSRQQKLNEDEDKKTLSQQVADGKYGLIQKELFSKPPKRPGVISYDNNSDVPKDNLNNLGGLDKNDIWLAENHLLVLKGGKYRPHDDRVENTPPVWPPIDDFKAPNRQVKIPSHPKVPPPFPVQLSDEGPLQILGTNSSRTINGTFKPESYPILPPEAFAPDSGPYFPSPYPYPPNATAGETPFPLPPFPPGDYYPGNGPPPFPFQLNGTLPPFFGNLPPGVAFLPPPDNLTEPIDEDDPSIYYPPPYSFYYPTDNSTQVPPGPLVPGIVLPPPPNFFAPYEEKNKTKEKSAQLPNRIATIRTTTEPTKQIHPTTTPLPPTSVINNKPNKIPVNLPEYNDLKPTTTPQPHIVTAITVVNKIKPNRTIVLVTTKKPYAPVERHPAHRRKPHPSVTILKPVKTSTTPKLINYYEHNEVAGKPFKVYGPPTTQKPKTLISTTQIPLKSYFSTSNEIETNSVTHGPEQQYFPAPKSTQKPPAQYYFYEEDTSTERVATQPNEETYLNIPKEYYVPARQVVRQSQRLTPVRIPQTPVQDYYYVNQQYASPSSPKPDTFRVHIARIKQHINNFYSSPRPRKEPFTTVPTSKPIYQFSFEAANYKQKENTYRPPQEESQDKFRPLPRYSVQIQPAVEVIPSERPVYQKSSLPQIYFQPKYQTNTEKPQYYTTASPEYNYQNANYRDNKEYVITPRPITQYSFEATQNPTYEQGYYTKQDERLFDDITKKYFTMFGKKLPNTSPIPREEVVTEKPYRQSTYVQQENVKPVQIEYAQSVGKPISLHGDTYVNYVGQNVQNPNAELIPIRQQAPKFIQRTRPREHSLHSDINVNYKQNRPITNQNAEIVEAINIPIKATKQDGKSGSYISYELPGDDGAHFYFLTPQLANTRNQGVGYYYSQPNKSRVRRNIRSNGS